MQDFKKIYLITYILNKSKLAKEDLIETIFHLPEEKMVQLLVIFNRDSFFNVIGCGYIERVRNNHTIVSDFDLVDDLHLKRLQKKDQIFVKKIFDQEVVSFVLFYENYIVFDLPVSSENIEYFKQDKNPKIYRYKRDIEIGGEVFKIEEILTGGSKDKKRLVERDYRIENILLN